MLSVMTSPIAKPTPVAVKVNAALPAATVEGVMDVRLNDCDPPSVIVNCIAPEVVVSGFMTRMLTAPATATWAADITVVSWESETTFVLWATPSQRICVPGIKFVPVAVSVNPALPAAMDAGEIEDKVGVTTPLNPPHPVNIVENTSNRKATLGRD